MNLNHVMASGFASVLALTVAVSSAPAAVITDTEFALTDWTAVGLTGSNPTPAVPNSNVAVPWYVVQTSSNVLTFYNALDGNFRREGWTSGPRYVFHRYDAVSYNPSTDGALLSLDFSIDAVTQSTATAHTIGGNFGLEQDGVVYLYAGGFHVIDSNEWDHFSFENLTADDFKNHVTGTTLGDDSPDFVNGGEIKFGYFRYTNNPAPNITFGADNFNVTGNPIPEPASLALIGLGSVLMLARRRH